MIRAIEEAHAVVGSEQPDDRLCVGLPFRERDVEDARAEVRRLLEGDRTPHARGDDHDVRAELRLVRERAHDLAGRELTDEVFVRPAPVSEAMLDDVREKALGTFGQLRFEGGVHEA